MTTPVAYPDIPTTEEARVLSELSELSALHAHPGWRRIVKFMDELNMPMRDKDLLFYENASRLFKIPIKPDATGLKSLLSRF